MSCGEAVGFAVAAGVAVTMAVLHPDALVAFAVTIIGGAVEGAALGAGQLIGLGRNRPASLPWLVATSSGAAAAWAIGLLPSTLELDFSAWLIPIVVLGGLVLLAVIPVAQWLVIRDRGGSAAWIPWNMLAWAAAVCWTLGPSPFIDERSPIALVVVLYLIAGALMALTVAVATAPVAARLFLPHHSDG